jgi:predicted phosphodiesterase
MRVAAIYDVHGNLPALEAVLADVRREAVDLVVVGGDVVPGPMPREALECLLSLDLPVRFVRGNGDRMVAEVMAGEGDGVPEQARAAVEWTARQLRPEHGRILAGWPATLRIDVDGLGGVLFCHATPRSDSEIFTRRTADDRLLPLFDGLGADLVVCGHTHMQLDRTIGQTRVVNAGSVGMPFGPPGAYWLLLDRDVRPRRTQYDLEAAATRIRATSDPQAEAFATGNVLRPPSEDAMLDAFSGAELR